MQKMVSNHKPFHGNDSNSTKFVQTLSSASTQAPVSETIEIEFLPTVFNESQWK